MYEYQVWGASSVSFHIDWWWIILNRLTGELQSPWASLQQPASWHMSGHSLRCETAPVDCHRLSRCRQCRLRYMEGMCKRGQRSRYVKICPKQVFQKNLFIATWSWKLHTETTSSVRRCWSGLQKHAGKRMSFNVSANAWCNIVWCGVTYGQRTCTQCIDETVSIPWIKWNLRLLLGWTPCMRRDFHTRTATRDHKHSAYNLTY